MSAAFRINGRRRITVAAPHARSAKLAGSAYHAPTEHKHYTFGDNDRASERLRLLSELYESETRALLERCPSRSPALAVDLGCEPGWSTRLVREVLAPERTVGLDASPRFVAEARERHGLQIEFLVHDVARVPFPVSPPDVMFCRYLLTHLRALPDVLSAWSTAAAPGGWMLIHENERLEASHSGLRRYYELLGQLQGHHGQHLGVGAKLEATLIGSGWRVIESERRVAEKPGRAMAALHLANLRTWRSDDYARRTFAPSEIDALEASLEAVASGREDDGAVLNVVRQIIARRAG